MKHYAILGILLLRSSLGQAQALTLQDALQSVQQNSPRIQRASSTQTESYWKKVETSSAFLPTISGSAQYLSTYKYLLTDINLPSFGPNTIEIPGIVPTTTYSLTAQWNLFDGFASTHRWRGAAASQRAAQEDLDWTRFEVQRQVVLQFYRAIAARTLKQVAEANLKTLEDHLHEVGLLKRSGLSTNYDVLRVEVQHSEATSEVLNTTDDVETATGRLAELMGQNEIAEPQGRLPDLRADLVDRLDAPKPRLDLVAMQDHVDALQLEKEAASAHWVPRVGLFGQYLYYNNLNDRAADWKSFRNSYEVGVGLTWNLFEGFGSEAKSREALEKRVQSEKSLKIAQLKARQDVSLYKRKFKYYLSVSKARQSDIGKAQESVRLAKEGRRVGSRTNTDLLDAETDLFRSQAGAINAQMGVIESLINLELSTGQKLYDFN